MVITHDNLVNGNDFNKSNRRICTIKQNTSNVWDCIYHYRGINSRFFISKNSNI